MREQGGKRRAREGGAPRLSFAFAWTYYRPLHFREKQRKFLCSEVDLLLTSVCLSRFGSKSISEKFVFERERRRQISKSAWTGAPNKRERERESGGEGRRLKKKKKKKRWGRKDE